MITIGMNYLVRQGKEEVFERAFYEVIAAMKSESGHKKSKLYRDCAEENNYLILSEWNSQQDFNNFIRSDKFAKVTNWGKEEILLKRPEHVTYVQHMNSPQEGSSKSSCCT